MNLPAAFVEKIKKLLGSEFDELRLNQFLGLRMVFIMMEKMFKLQNIRIILQDYIICKSRVL